MTKMTTRVAFGTAAFAVQVLSAMQMDNMFLFLFFFLNPEVSLQMKMLIASSFSEH